MFGKRTPRVHFVGIGGIGMSGIAELLLNLGYPVSGSDLKASDVTRRLEQLGGDVRAGHDASNVGPKVDVVVFSSAVRRDNPELAAARARGIPVIPRAEMLAELMRLKEGVAVAGSHGKTTTTSMIAAVCAAAGHDPTVVVGGKLNALGTNARLGKGDLIVVEADESDGSFLRLTPTWGVVTNVDPEHLDHFGTFDRLQDAFVEFCNRVPFYGLVALCWDHEVVRALAPRLDKRHTSYGFAKDALYRAEDVELQGFRTSFQVFRNGEKLGRVALQMVGAHNAQNALAVLAVADALDIPFGVARDALEAFTGVQRRFTVRGEARGVTFVDDYGHHPVEIRATLAGARQAFARRIVVAFQPHRYTRTHALMQEFAACFDDADAVLVTDIYAASEEPIAGVSAKRVVEAMRAHGHRSAEYVPRPLLARALAERLRPGDIAITQGAGDVTHVGAEALALLEKQA
jgi:UDP-N-acetylmuramate--alanine ligase